MSDALAPPSGRSRVVKRQDLTGATALLGAQIQHRLGRALSVKLTSATNADILVNITKY